MKVLLTGGTGYIGSHTAVALSQLGHEIVLFDNLSNSSELVIEKLTQITGKCLSFVKGDVRDTELVKDLLASRCIDTVIHFAGLKAVAESVKSPIDYYANNVQGVISLLQAMQAKQIKKLIFSSSATVYGQPQYLPLDENHATNPTNPYGRSKLQIEEILKDVASSDQDWRIVCLRYFNPVGAHESGLIGENPSGVPNNLMPFIAQVAAGLRTELAIFGDDYTTPDGTGLRDYIHVMDLAEGHGAALNFLSQAPGWHAFNLGTGEGYSVLEMVQAFRRVSGREVPYRFLARRAGDVAACYADPKKARERLNWSAARALDDICVSTWHFQQTQGLSGRW
jgi:UDP-glucose 4-epimerase